jgi:outer membrane lipoprotein SlyB
MPFVLAAALCGCGSDYSPNTYSSTAVQQANKVDQGVIVGVRRVDISAQSGVGAATGAAAGGIAGSQASDGVGSAIGALGGAVVGGIIGNAVDHKVNDTFGYEYIVRKPNKDLLSVTQKDEVPLAIGQHVLLIAGVQARIVADYTVPVDVEVEKPTAAEHVEPAPTTKAAAVEPKPKPVEKPAPAEAKPPGATESTEPAPQPEPSLAPDTTGKPPEETTAPPANAN